MSDLFSRLDARCAADASAGTGHILPNAPVWNDGLTAKEEAPAWTQPDEASGDAPASSKTADMAALEPISGAAPATGVNSTRAFDPEPRQETAHIHPTTIVTDQLHDPVDQRASDTIVGTAEVQSHTERLEVRSYETCIRPVETVTHIHETVEADAPETSSETAIIRPAPEAVQTPAVLSKQIATEGRSARSGQRDVPQRHVSISIGPITVKAPPHAPQPAPPTPIQPQRSSSDLARYLGWKR